MGVLNTFRQSKEIHSSMPLRLAMQASSAQRLSAIKGNSPPTPTPTPTPTPGAQRLSAIKGNSPLSLGSNMTFIELCSTPFGNQRKFTNANPNANPCSTPFGNQRKFTSIAKGLYGRERMCSTPFGNQRKFTPSVFHQLNSLLKCSTPFGNQRKFTPDRQIGIHWSCVLNAFRQSKEIHLSVSAIRQKCLKGAQRLSAIKGNSPPRVGMLHDVAALCSTPFGNQRKFTASLIKSCIRSRDCAQRLSAIKGNSLGHLCGGERIFFLCSTPFGNQRKFTVSGAFSLPLMLLCSTPFGNQRKFTD